MNCRSRRRFEKNFESAQQEARASFGNDGIYIEKFIVQPRHIETKSPEIRKECLPPFRKRLFGPKTTSKTYRRVSISFVDESFEKDGDVAIKAAKYINFEGMGTVTR